MKLPAASSRIASLIEPARAVIKTEEGAAKLMGITPEGAKRYAEALVSALGAVPELKSFSMTSPASAAITPGTFLGLVRASMPGHIELHPGIVSEDLLMLIKGLAEESPLSKVTPKSPGTEVLDALARTLMPGKGPIGMYPFGKVFAHEARHLKQQKELAKLGYDIATMPTELLNALRPVLENDADIWAAARLLGVKPEVGQFIEKRLRLPFYKGSLRKILGAR